MRHSWQRKREQANHTDDWLMTYADMITLLLCFFAIFLSVSIPKKDAPKTVSIPHPVEETVKQQEMLEGNLPFHGLPRAMQPSEHFADEKAPDVADKPRIVLPDVIDDLKSEAMASLVAINVIAPPPIVPLFEPHHEAAPSPAAVAGKAPATLPEIVDHLKTQGAADIQQKGDRITTLQMSSAAFFGSGSAALSASGKSILADVAVNLKSEKFKDYQVTVEGHTDDQPISTAQFPSNWELSTARGSAVVHFFLEQGISAQKLRAAGYADTFPIAPNRDAHGNPIPDNEAKNRRVVIKLEKIDRNE